MRCRVVLGSSSMYGSAWRPVGVVSSQSLDSMKRASPDYAKTLREACRKVRYKISAPTAVVAFVDQPCAQQPSQLKAMNRCQHPTEPKH